MTTRAKSDLKQVLPRVGDQHDGCLEFFHNLLQEERAVNSSDVFETGNWEKDHFFIHLIQEEMSFHEVRRIAQHANLTLQASCG